LADVVFDGVTKVFADGTRAVDNLSLAVADGEFMILVGPSGCGKTTALRMIAGLEDVTSGEIRIGGAVVNDLEPKARDISMVFQSYALYPHMTVRDNITFPLRMQRVEKAEMEARLNAAVEILGLQDLLHRRPRELSGGQRQRVAMGRAIVRHPRAFLMDEPLSNLDAKLRVQVRAELIKQHRRLGITTVYVTHDQTEAMTLGQRVAVLDGGVLQQVDTPERMYQNPANLFVASFVGSPPMNFVRGVITDGDQLRIGAHTFVLPTSIRSRLQRGAADVVVGIRPEDVELGGTGPSVVGEVEITELLGPETIAYLRLSGMESIDVGERPIELSGAFSARLDGRTRIEPGRSLTLTLRLDELHIFDGETGDTVLRNSEPR
jgi:multiple sugar transport system ATP-binding protein